MGGYKIEKYDYENYTLFDLFLLDYFAGPYRGYNTKRSSG